MMHALWLVVYAVVGMSLYLCGRLDGIECERERERKKAKDDQLLAMFRLTEPKIKSKPQPWGRQ